jgi:hypothetical protein
MWSVIRWLVLRIAAIRWLFKLGWLGALIPIALLLKSIGLPVLGILAVVAIPLLVLLFLFGLPIFLVLAVGGLFVGALGFALVIGLVALKFFLFVVLPIVLIWKLAASLWRWGCRRGGDGSSPDGGTPPASQPTAPSPGPASPAGADAV